MLDINNSIIINFGKATGGSTYTFPLSYTGNYSISAMLRGTEGEGIIQFYYNSISSVIVYVRVAGSGNFYTDDVYLVIVGY